MQPIANELEPIQISSFLAAIVIIVLIILQMRQQPAKKYWYIPMLFWMIHGCIFYISLFLDRAGYLPAIFDPVYTTWSSILRLHGYLTILITELERWKCHRRNQEK